MVRALPAVHPQNCCPTQWLRFYTVETTQTEARINMISVSSHFSLPSEYTTNGILRALNIICKT